MVLQLFDDQEKKKINNYDYLFILLTKIQCFEEKYFDLDFKYMCKKVKKIILMVYINFIFSTLVKYLRLVIAHCIIAFVD